MRERVDLGILVMAITVVLLPSRSVAQDLPPTRDESQAAYTPPTAAAQASTGSYVMGPGWRVDLAPNAPTVGSRTVGFALPATLVPLAQEPAAPRARPVAFEYSDAYRTRLKIHVYASIAMLPLFVTQYALGDSLYTNSTDGKRTAHAVVGSGIGILFGLNTVTGVWNLWEGRKNPSRKARRVTHGVMMLGADAGFLATAMLAPGDEGGGNRATHRAVAITSMAVATASYVFMLLTR